jgi:hypothetical protein
MSRSNARPFPRGLRNPVLKPFAIATIALGSLSLLGSGDARAASSTPIPCSGVLDVANAAPGTGTFFASILSETSTAVGTCNLVSSMPDYVTFDIDFNPVIMGKTAELTYSIAVSNPGWWFDLARVDSDVNITGAVQTTWRKEVFSDAGFTNKIWDYNSLDGSSNTAALPGMYSTLWVRDTYTVPADAAFDVGTNTFRQTPGPLPLLGAGTALGFSRRLRQRIKISRAA